MTESINRKVARRFSRAVENDNFTSTGTIAGQAVIYDSTTDLPTSNIAVGSQGYVSSNQRLYIRGSGGWYNIATINNTPTINSVQTAAGDSSPFTLATDGTTTTVIIINATDSEGFPITFSAVTDAGFDSIATVSQDSSVFTITPFSEDSTGTASSGTLTFKASDGVNIASEVATFTISFKVADTRLATRLIKASGNGGTNTAINDGSGLETPNTITINGNASAQSFTPYHPLGYSTYFNGSSHLHAAYNSVFNYGTSTPFTIDMWFYPTTSGASSHIANMSNGTADSNLNWLFRQKTDNTLRFVMKDGSGTLTICDSTDLMEIDSWNHVAIVMTGSSIKHWLNGVFQQEVSFAGTMNVNGYIQIGQWANNFYTGYITDFRYNVDEQVYSGTDDFTLPTGSLSVTNKTKLLACHLPYIADGSSSSHTITLNGSPETRRFAPYDGLVYNASSHGASVYFDGSGDYLSVATDTSLELGNSDFTIECWFYMTATPNNFQGLISMGQSGSTSTFASLQLDDDGGNSVRFFVSQYSTTIPVVQSSADLKLNTWNHVAVTRNGNDHVMYLNGVSVSTRTTSYTSTIGNVFYVGCAWYATNRDFQGYISDARLVKGDAVYTSNFTPPTNPLTGITNTSLLTCNDEPNVFDAAQGELVTIYGDVTSSTANLKNATANVLFPGSQDYIEVSFPELSDDDFTWEFWMYPTNINSNNQSITDPRASNTNNPLIWIRSTNVIYYYRGSDRIVGTTTLSSDTWYHVALVRTDGTAYLYINGALEGSAAETTSFTADVLRIGRRYTGTEFPYYGHIEDMRISKGLSRYPFIPQKTQLDATGAEFLIAHGASTTTESSSNNRTVTASGNPTMSNGPASGMKAIDFDGTGDYLLVDDCTEIGTSAFTFEMWIYFDAVGAYRRLWGNNTGGVTGSGTHTFRVNNSNTFEWWWGGSLFGSLAPVAAGQWYHIHLQRDSSNHMHFFLNGALVYENTNTSQTADNMNGSNAEKNYIGGQYSGGEVLDGRISNARLTIGTTYLKTKNFTPPTTALV